MTMRSLGAWAADGLERLMSVAVILLMLGIVLQVVCSALDINPLLSLDHRRFLIGKAITLNSLLDLQCYLLVIVGLVPAGMVWLRDRHVRVDFLYSSYSARSQARLNIAGNVLLAAPFLVMVLAASWDFMTRAWTSGEGSRNGGLADLWLIKAVLPLGLGLLLAAIMTETFVLARSAR